jgi:small-conductance mechanosensitive channel
MDWHLLHSGLQRINIELFQFGGSAITVASLLKLLLAAALLVLVAGRLSGWTVDRLLQRTHLDTGTRVAVRNVVHYVVLIVGAVIVLQNAGINLTAFAVVASALGVGVGFGLQNIISNFISGLIIMLERPIKVGDRIELAGVEGVVQAIGARRATVVTNDRIAILVPNQRFITDNVTNCVHLNHDIRLHVPLSLAPDSDPERVRDLLLEAARSQPEVRREPAPSVVLTTLGGTAMGFELLVWYDAREHARQELLSQLYFAIGAALRAQGIKTA